MRQTDPTTRRATTTTAPAPPAGGDEAVTGVVLRARVAPWPRPVETSLVDAGPDTATRLGLTDRSAVAGGRPVVPVSGELHYSRVPRERWDERLRLMVAGGVTVVATYVLWNHHEQVPGEPSFEGRLDLAAFVDAAASVGLDVVLRLGPWCHAEARHGGFPDHVQAAPVEHRTDDPAYLALVERWWRRLRTELGARCRPGGPIVAIQLENELADRPEHLRTLTRLAASCGLDAPIRTATAWGGADLPDDLLPLWGGYVDGFWVDADAPWDDTFRAHLVFSHDWDDPGIGADVRGDDARRPVGEGGAGDVPVAAHVGVATGGAPDWPVATCELGSGMATAYHRRPLPSALDVAAVGHVKTGSGSTWQGWYVFAGGANPRPGLQESRETDYPNDLPVFDYDFHAPVGVTGRTAESFVLLAQQHAFVRAFGETLAALPSSLPDRRPRDVRDLGTMRWAVRGDERRGFVFVSRHHPGVPFAEHEPVRFAIDGVGGAGDVGAGPGSGGVVVPGRSSPPVTLPAGTLARWPYGLVIDGVEIAWSTTSPLTVLDGAGRRALVTIAHEGVAPTVHAPGAVASTPVEVGTGSTLVTLRSRGRGPGREPGPSDERDERDDLDVLVLSPVDAARARVVQPAVPAGRADATSPRLVLCDEAVWLDDDGRLTGRFRSAATVVHEWSGGTRAFVEVALDGVAPDRVEHGAVPVAPASVPPGRYGRLDGRAEAPRADRHADRAVVWRLDLRAALGSLTAGPHADGGPHADAGPHADGGLRTDGGQTTGPPVTTELDAELELHWAGDVGWLRVDGEVVADRFWDGTPWLLSLRDLGIGPGSTVHVEIVPLRHEAAVHLPDAAARRLRASSAPLVALDRATVVRTERRRERR